MPKAFPTILCLLLLFEGASPWAACDEALVLSDEELMSCNHLCRLPLQPWEGCYIYPYDIMPGGIGAKMTSFVQYVFFAIESGCTYLHRRLTGVGHKADANRVEEYFNIGEQCVEATDLVGKISLRKVLLDAREARAGAVGKPFPFQCANGRGVLCEVPRASGLQLVSKKSEEIAKRILRARFYNHAKHDPDKIVSALWALSKRTLAHKASLTKVTWFHPAGNDRLISPVPAKSGSEVNIVLHVRRGDVHEDTGHGRFTPTQDIEKLLRHLCDALKTASRSNGSALEGSIHIASDGTEADFPVAMWSKLISERCPSGSSIRFEFDTALRTFTHFVAADILLYGVSSFPKLAALVYHEGVSRAYAKYERRKPKSSDPAEATEAIHNPVVIEDLFGEEFLEELLTHLQKRTAKRERQEPSV